MAHKDILPGKPAEVLGRSGAMTAAAEHVALDYLSKREFLSRVTAASGLPRVQVRAAVDAALAELGRAISAGESLALPPFGKARISKQKSTKTGGEVIVIRLRRRDNGEAADPAEDQADRH